MEIEHIKETCKIGQGAMCCRYLTSDARGFQCGKNNAGIKLSIDYRAEQMNAKGDNCIGYKVKMFEMTQEDFDNLVQICQPVPYIVTDGVSQPSNRDVIMAAWGALGAKMGFKGPTARPADGKSDLFFIAEPIE